MRADRPININLSPEKVNAVALTKNPMPLTFRFVCAMIMKYVSSEKKGFFMRLDKFLSETGTASRSESKKAARSGGVTVNGIEHIEYLPVMDFKNKSISLDAVTSFDVNKAIQRSLTKALARHGLGLYIYAGEDLPEEERANVPEVLCESCGHAIKSVTKRDGEVWDTTQIVAYSKRRFEGRQLCPDCQKAAMKAEG